MRKLIFLTLGLLVSLPPCVGAQYADNQRDAAKLSRIHQEQVRGAMNTCASQFAGKGGEFFLFLQQFWHYHNQPIGLASEMLWPHPAEPRAAAATRATRDVGAVSFMKTFGTADPGAKYRLCEMLATRAKAGDLDFSKAYSEEGKLLLAIFDANDGWRNTRRNADFTIGCMKQQWNAGNRDVSKVKVGCECQTAVMVKSASDQELEAWQRKIEEHAGNEAAVIAGTPWLQAALPAIAACKARP